VTGAIQTQLDGKAASTHVHSSLAASDGTPQDAVVVDAAGNVGIGTSVPTAKLHVAGSAGVDGIKFPDGTLQTS
jgi:hypothetical protein